MSILFSGLFRTSWKSSVSCSNEKVGYGAEEKQQLSVWSIMNINNFEGKVRIKFVFTFYFMRFWPVQLRVTAHWNPSILVDVLWISYLENWSKKVNLPIFAVLNMLKSTQDEENRTVVIFLRWLPNTIWIHTKSNGLFQKKSKPSRWQRSPTCLEFPRVLKNMEISGVN